MSSHLAMVLYGAIWVPRPSSFAFFIHHSGAPLVSLALAQKVGNFWGDWASLSSLLGETNQASDGVFGVLLTMAYGSGLIT